MTGLAVLNDTNGNVYVSAEQRNRLYKLCDRLGRTRNTIRWSRDLRCYVIVLSTKQGKKVLAHSQNSWQKRSERHGDSN